MRLKKDVKECGFEEGVACTVQCKHFNTCTRNPYKNKTTK